MSHFDGSVTVRQLHKG